MSHWLGKLVSHSICPPSSSLNSMPIVTGRVLASGCWWTTSARSTDAKLTRTGVELLSLLQKHNSISSHYFRGNRKWHVFSAASFVHQPSLVRRANPPLCRGNLFRRISPPETSRNRDGNKLGAIIIISSQRKARVENDKVEDDNDMKEGGNFVVVCDMDRKKKLSGLAREKGRAEMEPFCCKITFSLYCHFGCWCWFCWWWWISDWNWCDKFIRWINSQSLCSAIKIIGPTQFHVVALCIIISMEDSFGSTLNPVVNEALNEG